MIECVVQLKDDYTTRPFSEEDLELLREFKPNQLLRAKLYGVKKPRSYQQLKLYWACCQTVADNLENKSKEDVDFATRVELKFIKNFKVEKNLTYIELRSISFKELPHIMACNYFERAFKVLARMIGVKENVLLKNSGGG
jgi:hypothetical protein